MWDYFINQSCRRCGVKPIYSDDKRAWHCPPCADILRAEAQAEIDRQEECPQVFDIPGVDA